MSPNYAQDQTMFLGTGSLTMPFTISECAEMQSTNGGLTFSVMAGLPTKIVQSIAFSPDYATDGTVFMAGLGGLYVSHNRGSTWRVVAGPWGTLAIVAIALAPDFATSGAAFAVNLTGIYSSTDRGQTWQQLANPSGVVNGFTAVALAPDYSVNGKVVLGTSNSGIFASQNRGQTWQAVTQGLTLSLVSGFAFSPAFNTDHTLFATTTGTGVFESGNGAGAWTARNTGLTDLNATSIALSPNFTHDSTLWVTTATAGVFKSANRSASWTVTGAPRRPLSNQSSTHFVSLAAGNGPSGTVLFLGMFEGLFTSTDGGAHWLYCDTLPTRLVRDLQLSPDYPSDQTVFVSTYGGGILWSTNAGSSWYFENTGLVNSYTDAVAMSPDFAFDGIAWVGTVKGLERITSGGTTWQMMQMLGQQTFPRALGVSPGFTQDSTLFIGTHLGVNHPVYVTYQGQQYFSQGLFVSVDAGQDWEPTGMPCAQPSSSCLNGPPIDSIALSPNFTNDHTLFAGSSANGLFKSTNGAAGPFVALAPVPLSSDPAVVPVAVSPNYAADQTVVVSTSHSGVFKSTDGGSSWSLLPGTTSFTVFSIAFSPNYAKDHTLFLGTLQFGLLKSSDGGARFQSTTLPGDYVTAVAISPGYANDQTLFAASYLGLYKSTDGGTTWTYTGEPARQEEQRQFPPGAFNTINYQGSWSVTQDAAASTMQYAATTQQSGASASLTFLGSGAEWNGLTGPSGGAAQVLLDGVPNATVNLYSPAIQEQVTLWIVRALPCGVHTVTIQAMPGTNQNVTLDSLDVWQDTCSTITGAPSH